MAIGCVVFDVDDTLYLERDYARSGFFSLSEYARDTLGIADFGAAAWALFEAGARRTIFNDVVRDAGVADEPSTIAELVRRYRGHEPNIALATDARAALDRIFGRLATGAITDGPAASQRAKVSALGLEAWIPTIVVTDELGREFWKPHPRAFERVQSSSGCEPAACAYVADNPHKDFVAPRVLGWTTVRIRRDGALHVGAPSGDDVDYEIRSLDELDKLIGI